ncbi:MAG: hypothetical protein EZS28_028139 [Streblomastix strix]|uniref:Uncharacterized protein n=1 Tax=Streblomastix strix TaxID=222440 RepID=A0A5J4V2Q6_9EUKA|nr:MAG: hypothetical protein EZS28_028139 [Streblomastix strix]
MYQPEDQNLQQSQELPPFNHQELLEAPYGCTILSSVYFSQPDTIIAETAIRTILKHLPNMKKERKLDLATKGLFDDFAQLLSAKPETELAENICEIVSQLLKDQPDLADVAIEAKFLTPLLTILSGRNEQVKHVHTYCLFTFSFNTEKEVVRKLVEADSLRVIVRLLDIVDNTDILNDVVGTLYNIVLSGKEMNQKTDPHAYFSLIDGNGGINKLVDIHNKCLTEFTKGHSALTVGRLYRTLELPAQYSLIIDTLKEIVINREATRTPWDIVNAIGAIRSLALNPGNHERIVEDDFIDDIVRLLNTSKDEQILLSALLLIWKLYTNGGPDTRLIVRKSAGSTQVLARIKALTASNLDRPVQNSARTLLELLTPHPAPPQQS